MFYRTHNITLASYLATVGIRLDAVERNRGNQVTFVFQDPSLLAERYEKAFHDGTVEVNLHEFMVQLNALRDVIFKQR